jgi:hypothetical protein
MTKELLQQGIAALKAGCKDEARRLLEQVVQENPRSEQGWLWLSGAVDTDEERRFCLAQILSINPRNALAQRGLEVLGPGPVLSPTRPEPRQGVEGPGRSSTEPEEPPEQPMEEPPVTSAAGITCPRCDTVNSPDFRFCDRCGASLVPPDLDDTQPVPIVKPPPVGKVAPLAPKPTGQAPPIELRPQQTETQNAEKKTPSLVAVIIAGLGCLLVVGGGLGLMEGDPSALICWVPGIILTIAGFILNASSKKQQTGRKGVPPPTPEPPRPTPPIEHQPEPKEEREAGKGKWLSMGCASVVIVCFFLPWITVSCAGLQNYVETWSGYDLASGGIHLVTTVNVGDTQVLYVIPAAALVFIILLFSGRRRVGGGMATLVTLLTLAAGGALASVYAAVQEEIKEFVSAASEFGRAGYTLEFGLWGTIIGLVGMALGAIADAVSGD